MPFLTSKVTGFMACWTVIVIVVHLTTVTKLIKKLKVYFVFNLFHKTEKKSNKKNKCKDRNNRWYKCTGKKKVFHNLRDLMPTQIMPSDCLRDMADYIEKVRGDSVSLLAVGERENDEEIVAVQNDHTLKQTGKSSLFCCCFIKQSR